MKTKCMFAVFLIFLFLFQSCSQKQEIKPIDISLEKDLEIGIEEGDENYMFAGVIDVEVDSKGNIFVLDWKNRTVKKFDNKGKFICDIGKKGQGPGEYSAILVDSCLDRSDRFYVVELMKVHIFFGTIPIEEQGRPSTIRQNWMFFNIYSDESDFPKVTRYKIVYNESKKQENNGF